MDLVVGASESTMKSVLSKLSALLAEEYTLIRGVGGDLQYISDELATMRSFLRDLGAAKEGQDHRMKDWMKQIRDITYDIEDCIDDSSHRIHGLPSDMSCYFLVNSIYEVLTWWPRRDMAAKISILKMRAQQISERRQRYGVDNPRVGDSNAAAVGFDAAGNQDRRLQLVSMKDPVGVGRDMEKLEEWVVNEEHNYGVLSIVGFGGVGKTSIATALYQKFGDRFDHRATVTVSQSSDIEAILTSIKSQVMVQSNDYEELHIRSEENRLVAAVKGCLINANHARRAATAAVMAQCQCGHVSEKASDVTRRDNLIDELRKHFTENSYMVLIDDLWSATTWDQIRKSFPPQNEHKKRSRIIVTTRFQAIAEPSKQNDADLIHKLAALPPKESEELFKQAFLESQASKDVRIPDKFWQLCGGLPLAIVLMAGFVACNTQEKQIDWDKVCTSLFPDKQRLQELLNRGVSSNTTVAGKDIRRDLTQEELGRIVSYCYNDMPSEIKTCSLYLSIFPKGSRISRKRLIRRWMAEGFVGEKQGMSVEDVAETYFSHLVRRKIIRTVEHSSSGKVKKCSVHDMVLEHIVSQASEENFITVVGGHWLMHLPSTKVRRLSLQISDSTRAKDTDKMNLSHVRSLTMFGSLNQLPSHSFNFGIVQVLDLEGCRDFSEHHIVDICSMPLLKYLSLRGTDIRKLPKTIGKLGNLETLDVRETNVVKLPKTVCNLERLINLLGGDRRTRKALKLPQEAFEKKNNKMKALRILSGIEFVGGSADLHHLTDLRKLAIYKLNLKDGDTGFKDLRSSIEYLCGYSLHTLLIDEDEASSKFLLSISDLSPPPRFLIALELSGKMVKLPGWITQLDALNKLTLSVTLLEEDNLKELSNLKALFSLTFTLTAAKQDRETMAIIESNKSGVHGGIVVPADGFDKLKLLRFSAPRMPLLIFSKNAMTNLERLEVRFTMLEGLLGTENLQSLKEVHLGFHMKRKMYNHLKVNDDVVQEIKKRATEHIIAGPQTSSANKPKITFDQYYN